ncbi:MAG: GntR family transcriptional regulator [Bacillota bacterium]
MPRRLSLSSTPAESEKSLEDQVYDQLLNLLLKRGVADTGTLSDQSVAESLGVSRTPVRIAFARLESEGLLLRSPGKGWALAPLTPADIEEIFELKEVLETMVARKAAMKITPAVAETLKAIVEEMRQISAEGNLEKWLEVDDRFHDVLFGLSGNERLKRFVKQLNNQYHRFRVGFLMTEGRMLSSYEEHRAIAEAVMARDPDLAVENTLKHLHHVRSNLLSIMEKVLIPFLGQQL